MHGLKHLKDNPMVASNKIALVFGSNGSIGSTISEHLRSRGIITVGIGRRKSPKNTGLYYCCDLNDENAIYQLRDEIVKKYGIYHYMIMSQGIQNRKPIFDYTLTEWNEVINLNLTSNFLIFKYFCTVLKQNNFGRIVAISSLTSRIGIRDIGAYAASKGGLEQLMMTLSIELSKYEITVNTINPGRIQTAMTQDLYNQSLTKDSLISRIPKGRFGVPEDLLSAIDFLIDERSSYITGQSIIIDGGWIASGGNPLK